MFDTPDLGPLCVSPFITAFIVLLIYIAGRLSGKQWRNSVPLLFIVFLPFVCIFSAALGIGEREPRPWQTPTIADVVGTWQIEDGTKDYLEKYYKISVLPHELVFHSDGTFSVTNCPTFWGLWDQEQETWVASYVTGKGIWSFAELEDNKQLEPVILLTFEELTVSGPSRESGTSVNMYFVGHLPPYALVSLSADKRYSFRRQ